MTSYDDTKVQLTINRMTEECYENVPSKSSTELYLISQDPTSIAKIDLDAQSRTDAEISSIQSDLNAFQSDLNTLSTEVSTLSDWTTTQIDGLIGDVQEVSSQTAQNAQDIADISANLTHSTVRRWEYVEDDTVLTFTAHQPNSTVAMQKVGSAPEVSLEYTTDGGYTWNDFLVSSSSEEGTTVTLTNIGDQVGLRAKTPNAQMATADGNRNTFSITGSVVASGNLASLFNKDVEQGKVLDSTLTWHIGGLFRGCSGLVGSAKNLKMPFDQMYGNSCETMFRESGITVAPDLPCMTIGIGSYSNMFKGCSSLTTAPELPATTLANYSYYHMFENCTTLTTPPSVLPAEETTQSCYTNMFYGCTSLTRTPVIKLKKTQTKDACGNMFQNCTSLTSVSLNDLEEAYHGQNTFSHVFEGCTALKEVTLPKLRLTGGQNWCMASCFKGCSNLEKVYLTALSNVYNYGTLDEVFRNCTSLTHVFFGAINSIQPNSTLNNAFNGCSALEVVDFSQATVVPSLSNTNAFANTNNTFQIVVPDALYSQWIVASNWSSFASQIVKASEYISN